MSFDVFLEYELVIAVIFLLYFNVKFMQIQSCDPHTHLIVYTCY